MKTLIIDRVKLFQEMIATILSDTDIEHVFSTTGKEAIETLTGDNFDCICLALYLDDMDGFELTQKIRKIDQYRHTPIVLLTSKNSEDITKQAISSGITDIFSKEHVPEIVNFIARFTEVNKPLEGKVLYVEDQKSQRDFITAILKERNLEVDSFDNAEDALQAFLKQRYHLVITDLVLDGEISGVLLINKIRRLDGVKGDIPILAITAFDDNSRRISLYHMGITDYVTKPVIKEELLARVRNLINNQKALEREIDFREHLNSEEVVRRSLKMEALGKLTGGIAHDYNNMLGVITGFADLLQESLGDEQPKLLSYVDAIKKAGVNGAKLTSKLLSFTRKEAASAEIANINNLIFEAQPMLEKLLTAAIKLNINLDEDLWNTCIDVGDFENALLNLCINAKHAIGEKGVLSIVTSNAKMGADAAEKVGLSSGEYIRLSIKDSGSGMDKDTVAKIFDPFFSTKGDGGTGLGLSQVYGLMQRVHGSIKVDSKVGKGSVFNLYFPRDKKETIEHENISLDKTVKNEKVYDILVVDDEVALAELTAEILKGAGHRATVSYNAGEAIAEVEKKKFDVMVSDVIMPGLNGFELSQKVKAINPEIKIIIVSGYNDKINSNMELKKYCDSNLEKPVSNAQLIEAINMVLK